MSLEFSGVNRRFAEDRLPFLEGFRDVGAPGVVAVVVGPGYLIEGKLPPAVVPASEADVVGIVAIGDFDEVAKRCRIVVYRKRWTPSIFAKSRSKVPIGICPAFFAMPRTRQSEKSTAVRFR